MLKEQKQAVEHLISGCGSVEAAADYVGVSPDSIFMWRSGAAVAKGLTRRKLLDAVDGFNKISRDPPSKPARGGIQRVKKEERLHIENQLKRLRLAPPHVRAALLRSLLERGGLNNTEMARALKIHKKTLLDYLDPEYAGLLSLSTANRIKELERTIKSGEMVGSSLEGRLKAAHKQLLGEEIALRGFSARDSRRSETVEKLSAATGLSTRAVRRYLPPLDLANRRVPARVVEAFEQAAVRLGAIIIRN